jgi:sugar/nucleoside kinase (ribokinase family)/nucleoside 2-deoxyribosyltransferase
MTDVVVIGGIFREQLPPADRPVRRIGGSGFVAALTAAALGAKVSLVSYVGEHDARAALAPLRRAGVDTSAVEILPGVSGIFSLTDLIDRSAPRPSYRPAEAVPSLPPAVEHVTKAPVVLAFGFPDFDPMTWITAAVRPGGTLLWDRQGWLSRNINRLQLDELPVATRIYLANLEEMRAEANRERYVEALAEQPAAGFDAALIKCGRWGTVAITSANRELVPAFLATPASVIGSGDCFAGAVAARLAQGDSLGQAAHVGAASASLFVERQSNTPSPALADGVAEVLKTRSRCAVDPVAVENLSVYLAGPWFTTGESLLIGELEAVLENLGLTVISPRRDIGQLPQNPTREEILAIGREDYAAVDECALVVAVLDGDDPGTLMEVGYAAKAGKPIIGLSSLPDVVPQPMRDAANVRVTASITGVVDEVTRWVRDGFGIG